MWVFPAMIKRSFFMMANTEGGKSSSPTHTTSTGRKRNWFSNFAEFLVLFWCERNDIESFFHVTISEPLTLFIRFVAFGLESDLRTFYPRLFILELIRMSQLSLLSLRHRSHIGWRQTSWCHSQLDEVICKDSCNSVVGMTLTFHYQPLVQHSVPWN